MAHILGSLPQLRCHDLFGLTHRPSQSCWTTADIHDGRALLGTFVFGSLAIVLPKETPVSKGEKMDWVGSFLGISALILFNFVWK